MLYVVQSMCVSLNECSTSDVTSIEHGATMEAFSTESLNHEDDGTAESLRSYKLSMLTSNRKVINTLLLTALSIRCVVQIISLILFRC